MGKINIVDIFLYLYHNLLMPRNTDCMCINKKITIVITDEVMI